MSSSVLLLGRDLRLDDHPALAAASRDGRQVVPLFVYDDSLLAAPTMGPNRLWFLSEALADLRAQLRARGGELFLRRGDPAAIAVAAARAAGADEVHCSDDVTARFKGRRDALGARCQAAGIRLAVHPGVTVVPADALAPSGGGDHYRVFTPYWRAWSAAPRRPVVAAAAALRCAQVGEAGELLDPRSLAAGSDPVGRRQWEPFQLAGASPQRLRGGESAAQQRLAAFDQAGEGGGGPGGYDSASNDLAAAATSRLSAYLHFGCLSPARLEAWALQRRDSCAATADGVDALVRQLCWRDFYHAVTNAFPAIARQDYRRRPIEWRRDDAELLAWKQGRTGVELVDAAQRQLLEEGFVHNRARLVAASYLVKTLRHHWREGADHYLYWLTDGDVANNSGNWQWMAGTGNDTRPNRVLNPQRQAERFDPDGAYRRRYLGLGPS